MKKLSQYQGIKGTLTDIDGNAYPTVQIGNQVWTAKDLKVTHYRNGEAIPYFSDIPFEIRYDLKTGIYCDYDNMEYSATLFGHLYNWYAVNDNRQIAPKGWHIPSDEEWQILIDYLGGESVAGGKMKVPGFNPRWIDPDNADWLVFEEEMGGPDSVWKALKKTGYSSWKYPNSNATNESGFSAEPGGINAGCFNRMELDAFFWSSTEYDKEKAWHRLMGFASTKVYRNKEYKSSYLSVRLIRDKVIVAV